MKKSKIENIDDVIMSPLFIVGAPRSGTTWLQRMFLSHPSVAGGQETNFFTFFAPAITSVELVPTDNERVVGLSPYWAKRDFYEEIKVLWKKTFTPLISENEGHSLLVEKTPDHCFQMESIKKILPNSKFIHIIRDSRSVVASMLAASQDWGRHWAPSCAKDASIKWWRSVTSGRLNGSDLNEYEYLEVHYESLLAHPKIELERIFDFSDLTYNDELITKIVEENCFDKQKNSTKAAFVATQGDQLIEPKGFHRKGTTDSWKTDLSWIEKLIVWRYTRRLMRECGYTWRGFVGKGDD